MSVSFTGTQGSSPIEHACKEKHTANAVYWLGKDEIQLAVDIKTDMGSKHMKLARLMTAEESRHLVCSVRGESRCMLDDAVSHQNVLFWSRAECGAVIMRIRRRRRS